MDINDKKTEVLERLYTLSKIINEYDNENQRIIIIDKHILESMGFKQGFMLFGDNEDVKILKYIFTELKKEKIIINFEFVKNPSYNYIKDRIKDEETFFINSWLFEIIIDDKFEQEYHNFKNKGHEIKNEELSDNLPTETNLDFKILNRERNTYIRYNKKDTKIGGTKTRKSLLMKTIQEKGWNTNIMLDSLFAEIKIDRDSKNTNLSDGIRKNKAMMDIITTTIKETNEFFKKQNISLHLKHEFDNKKSNNVTVKISLD